MTATLPEYQNHIYLQWKKYNVESGFHDVYHYETKYGKILRDRSIKIGKFIHLSFSSTTEDGGFGVKQQLQLKNAEESDSGIYRVEAAMKEDDDEDYDFKYLSNNVTLLIEGK